MFLLEKIKFAEVLENTEVMYNPIHPSIHPFILDPSTHRSTNSIIQASVRPSTHAFNLSTQQRRRRIDRQMVELTSGLFWSELNLYLLFRN